MLKNKERKNETPIIVNFFQLQGLFLNLLNKTVQAVNTIETVNLHTHTHTQNE